MNIRPTHSGAVDPNKKAFIYQKNQDLVFQRPVANDIPHGYFLGGRMAYNWDVYVRDE